MCAHFLGAVSWEKSSRSGEASDTGSGSVSTALPEVQPDNRTVRCTKAANKCYALWTVDPQNKSNTEILSQGCWETSGKCDEFDCETDGKPSKASAKANNTKFCCCAGDMCNVHFSEREPSTSTDDPKDFDPGVVVVNNGRETWIIILTSVVSVIVVASLVLVKYRRLWLGLNKPSPDAMHLMESSSSSGGGGPSTSLDLEHLRLLEMVGRGRYGTVWRGTLGEGGGGDEVAVKVFVHQHRQYYLNERDIYTLPFMEHPSITRFLGGEEKAPSVDANGGGPLGPEYYLVMSHAPYGCLQDYLRRGVVDWTSLCRMTQSIAKGLAHMHTDIRRGDKTKPCISHRDINSRNVLVKSDLSCALCDMGFAMKIAGSKYYGHDGEEQHAETTSLTDVGTLRYMAPEVLEGAVNLRDCESSLKQIDVYAFGLVLWEVASRCSDLYQGLEVPAYRLPFEAEIGLHPTFEQMQVLVSRHKARPLFPDIWKETNLAVRLLKETIEDCWDQDAEARLTSLCVEERLQELPVLWDRHKANIGVSGVSPTVNQTSSNRISYGGGSGGYGSNVTSSNTTEVSSSEVTDRNANIMGIVSLADTANAAHILAGRGYASNGSASNWQRTNPNNRESSVSENTVETTVTWSPSEPTYEAMQPLQQMAAAGKNVMMTNNHMFPWLPVPLQPHQGRNPCLERNMIMEPMEELAISGNTLLERGVMDKGRNVSTGQYRMNGTAVAATTPDIGELFEAFHLVDYANNAEGNALVSHDMLSNQMAASSIASRNGHPPIPYLQNAVHGPNGMTTASPSMGCPKQPNIPGNGHSSKRPAHHQQRNNKKGLGNRSESKRPTATSSSRGSARWGREWGGIRSLLDWTRLTRGAGSGGEEEIDKVESRRSNLVGGSVAQRAMSDSTLNTEKSSNLNAEQLDQRHHRNQLQHLGQHQLHYHNEQNPQRQPLLQNQKVQTKVCLRSNGGPINSGNSSNPQTTVVRLTSYGIHHLPNGSTNLQNDDHLHNGGYLLHDNSHQLKNGGHYRSAELGVAKLQVPPGYAPVIRTRSGSLHGDARSDASESHISSQAATLSPARRPNTLLLKENSHQLEQPSYLVAIAKDDDTSRNANYFQDTFNDDGPNRVNGNENQKLSMQRMQVEKPLNTDRHQDRQVSIQDSIPQPELVDNDIINDGRHKIEQRVKTPFELKPGRFSLYDDRMMSSWPAPTLANSCKPIASGGYKLSLSMPVDINSLCSSKANDILQRCRGVQTSEVSSLSNGVHQSMGECITGSTEAVQPDTENATEIGDNSSSSSSVGSSTAAFVMTATSANGLINSRCSPDDPSTSFNNLHLVPPYTDALPPSAVVIRDRLDIHNNTVYQVS